LLLAGNAYRGVGLPDCIASGERAAEAALSHVHALGAKSDAPQLARPPMVTSAGQRFS
jgi:oxygen-dependent protoporphyrinogen oxidase